MWKIRNDFWINVVIHETEDYSYRMQNCIQILLNSLVKKDLWKN